ncbi:hypothetical protein ACONUD_07500 [Microbulbifer harenosus]|uniref:DUF4282 domain-containing protein n=2 Tax=Microbulbifer harenosus TaxID=2576840 RepID=A0ABY2UE40_9GAMM|nr:hypothetical protein FDY93_19330 [Microbulbifer harenosus]
MYQYEFIQNMIRLIPVIMLLPSFLALLRFKWYLRLGAMFFLGWIVVAGSTLLFWEYSIMYAPNEEIKMDLAQRDGAPKVFGTLFGWVYGLIILFIFELTRLIYLGVRKVHNQLRQQGV